MAEFAEVTKIDKRIHDTYACEKCPIGYKNNGKNVDCWELRRELPEEFERICLEWAKEHPIQTYLDKLKELIGECDDSLLISNIEKNGCSGFSCQGRKCDSCERKDFWNKEYKAPTEEVSE